MARHITEDLIEQYFKGTLSQEATAVLEAARQADPALQHIFAKHELMNRLLEENRWLQLKKSAQKTYQADQIKQKTIRYSLWGSLIVAMGIGGYVLISQTATDQAKNNPNAKQPFKTNTVLPEHPERPVNQKVNTNAAQDQKPTGMTSVEDGKRNTHADIPVYDPDLVGHVPTEHMFDSSNSAQTMVHLKEHTNTASSHPKEVASQGTTVAPEDPCLHKTLYAHVTPSPTCLLEEKGAVSLSQFQGGTAPYSFKIINEAGETVLNHHLKTGKYTLWLTDAQLCKTALETVWIKTKTCTQSYAFNPFVGEKWEMPAHTQAGQLTIVDKAGNTYLSKMIDVGNTELWDGSSDYGDAKTGYYLFQIKYADGTEQRGSVTIVK